MPGSTIYEFETFRLDAAQGVLFAGKDPMPLRPLPCEVLRVFLNYPQQILSTDFLIKNAWSNQFDVSDEAVTFQIHCLRKILADDPKRPRFIETVRKRGFRFIPKVHRLFDRSEASELYEKARYLYHKSVPDEVTKAIRYYERVISLNADYIPDAHAGIAESYILLGTFANQTMPATHAMARAREAALRALSLDEELAEAHAAIATIAALHDWKWDLAETHYQNALRVESNPLVKPMVRAWYANCLAGRGDAANARKEIDLAKKDFPTSFVLTALSGRVSSLARDDAKAIAECEEGIALEPHFFLNHLFKAHAFRNLGRYSESHISMQMACDLNENNPVCLAELAHLQGLQSRAVDAMKIYGQLQEFSASRYISPHLFAVIHLGLGQFGEMFPWLWKAYEERSAYMAFLTTDAIYDPVRNDRRFEELVRKVGFAEK